MYYLREPLRTNKHTHGTRTDTCHERRDAGGPLGATQVAHLEQLCTAPAQEGEALTAALPLQLVVVRIQHGGAACGRAGS